MTRKRYIKLTMADGIERNHAQAMARNVQTRGLSYDLVYAHEVAGRNIIRGFTDGLRRPIQAVRDAAMDMGTALRAAVYEAFAVPLGEIKALLYTGAELGGVDDDRRHYRDL